MINGGREKGWTILGNGGGWGGWGGVLWGVIEFLSPPALSEPRLSVWLSVLGADRQVGAWTDCLTSGRTRRRCRRDAWEVFPSAWAPAAAGTGRSHARLRVAPSFTTPET